MNQWYEKLFKSIEGNDHLIALKVTEQTFSENYQQDFSIKDASFDLEILGQLNSKTPAKGRLVKVTRFARDYGIKLYSIKDSIPLSQSMPIFESMGLKVLIGRPYRIKIKNRIYWIHHFTLESGENICAVDEANIPLHFGELFDEIWMGKAENDAFNELLFKACLKSRYIQILRAYTAYLQQIRFPHSREYIIETLNTHPGITLTLVNAFLRKFDPTETHVDSHHSLFEKVADQLLRVESLDHDLIFKRLLNLIYATVRTNFYQQQEDSASHLSFKLESAKIDHLPKPFPLFEIFVYSARFEGIHLRGGKVARGGLRWSDRREDYRTEVLGLMKAQMVKNAVIVPAGSKGGFVTKRIAEVPADKTFDEVRECYSLYINSLLELTDNRSGPEIVHPMRTRIHDEEDPYLVVAADKGTATFSDVANDISREHDFWLDDAFASGGSQGYDHKKMGITARGAWESVKRHFRTLRKDIQNEAFTVVGIGDMSGDVFGNGMLLSPCIKLVAAFNHLHIFIDPDPNIKKSYAERERLFKLPRSSWQDYNSELISKGGGVFSRRAKSIELSPEMQSLLDTRRERMTPNELIVLILKAPVELIWNGGIGTYIKASGETNASVSDKANDEIRITGSQLRAKVIGEGGNLGLTQRGRIEYAQHGGLCYTDSIDNSAGVNCSDIEVNIKILLEQLVKAGRISATQRNKLLVDMTDDVAEFCLENNYYQSQIIDNITLHAAERMHEHARYMRHLEREKIMSRFLEHLPNDDQVTERIAQHKGLVRPELAILISYSKLTYKNALLESASLHEECYNRLLLSYFPRQLRALYADEILLHPLRREIIATMLSNRITNNIGIGFGYRIREETGANIEDIARAYVITVDVFDLKSTFHKLDALDNKMQEVHRHECFQALSGLLERSISWLLRNQLASMNVDQAIDRYLNDVNILREVISGVLTGQSRKNYVATRRRFISHGLPSELAQEITDQMTLASAFDIIEIKTRLHGNTEQIARVFYHISERLQLPWIRNSISSTEIYSHWNNLAIVNLRNDLHANQRNLTELVLQTVDSIQDASKALQLWEKRHAEALERYDQIINEITALQTRDFATISILVNEVRRLVQIGKRTHYVGY